MMINAKEVLVEAIRAVPIAGKTYEEYVEAIAERLANTKTNYDRIRDMSIDEMASFFADVNERGSGFIGIADHYICQKCKREHGGECPVSDDQPCIYENDNASTIKLWLQGEVEE